MTELSTFLQANIIPIYFLYGLAHFITGFAVALETGRTSQLQFSRAMPFLAGFALVHGSKEWLEMLSRISDAIPTCAREPEWGDNFKLVLMVLSLVFLLQFGVRLLNQLVPEHGRWLRWVQFASIALCLAGIFYVFMFQQYPVPETQVRVADVWTRYSLGLPAASVATLAMLVQRRVFFRENMPQFGRDLVGAALAFGWYALLDNVIVPKAPFFPASAINSEVFFNIVGVPVQLFRAGVLATFAFFMIRMLRVFEVEYARRLETANRARFEAQEAATRELTVMFETCRTLGTSLDVAHLLNESLIKIVTLLDPMVVGMIYLHDPAEHALVLRASQKRSNDVVFSATDNDCARHAAEAAFASAAIAYETNEKSVTSFIAVPLVTQGRTVGAMCLAHREAFSNFAVIHTLARQLGIALENAWLYEQVQEKERLRGQLLGRAVVAQEEERKRIARELHDETGQMLTALAVGLGAVEETVTQNSATARNQVAQLKSMTMNAIESLRQFVSDLRPSVLDDMGLVSALRWYVEQFSERAKLRVEFQVAGAKRRLPSQVETVLFRIAQEGLNNVGRHARASLAIVSLEFGDSAVILTVEDNGRGFVVDQVIGTHAITRAWGLLGVQERVELVGGKFAIDSVPGRGTRLIVEIPVEQMKDEG